MSTLVEGKNPWQHKLYAKKFWVTMFILAILMASLPYFFMTIQKRTNGVKLNDFVLQALPGYDCSLYIFIGLYVLVGIVIYYSWSNSWSFYRFATAYTIVTLMRVISITLFPLNPPDGIIYLDDPFISYMYGGTEVNKDLFFSGHTSTVFLIYLVFRYSGIKYFALSIVFFIAVMLLIQHIHYTIDVLAAFPLTYLAYRMSFLIFKDPIDRKWFELKLDKASEKLFEPQ